MVATLRDGKVASFHSYFDVLSLLAQIGVVPAAAA